MQVLSDCTSQIQGFAKLSTNNPKATSMKKDKEKAFKDKLDEMTTRFKKTSQ